MRCSRICILRVLVLSVSLSAGWAPLSRAGQAGPEAPSLTRAEQEDFLHKARVVKVRSLSEGITNSQRATLADGRLTHDAHIQTVDEYRLQYATASGTELNFRDTYKFNIAAYKLDQILQLNMVPVSVERKVRGKTAAVTWWVDDVLMTEKQRFQKSITAPDPEAWNNQMHAVRIFDQLIYNTDRNLGNVVITKGWQLWMIDHTRAFRSHKTLRSPENLRDVRCDRKLLAGLRALHESVLKRELGRYLSKTEIDAILARRNEIVKILDQQIAERGEEFVLCDLGRT